MADEPIPIDDIFTDLDSQWNASNVTKPSFITVNAANEPIRFDLNVGDHLVVLQWKKLQLEIGNMVIEHTILK